MKTKIIKKAYKFRIYPTLEQISFFAKSFGCVRKVHNLMSDDRKKAYKEYKSISKNSINHYFASILCEEEIEEFAKTNKNIGIDLGIKEFATMSDCTKVENLKLSKEYEKKLKREQRKLSRRCKFAKVPIFYPSSKTCSSCRNIKETLKLSERIYHCECCGLEIDRDYNASINILRKGLEILKKEKVS